MAKAARPVPEGYQTVTPYLVLDDCAAAIEWYKKALGAEELGRSSGPEGKIMHAEIRIGNARVMLSDAMMGNKGPKALGGSPASLFLYVEDCDTWFARAVKAGANGKMPPADQFWGDRFGSFEDPHGYTWSVATRKEDLTPEETEQRAAEFFKQMQHQPAGG